jgi:hypothetical protein
MQAVTTTDLLVPSTTIFPELEEVVIAANVGEDTNLDTEKKTQHEIQTKQENLKSEFHDQGFRGTRNG